jgi:hypothetical protein
MTSIYFRKDNGNLILELKGKNTLVTKDNCMELMGWTVEQYNTFTVYAPYIPSFLRDVEYEGDANGKEEGSKN